MLDIFNYTIFANNIPIKNTTNTTSNIAILDKFTSDKVILTVSALDTYGLPIFASFDLYFGSISMPVHISFKNQTAAPGILVRANLTDYPDVSQSGYTDVNGTIIFKNVPLRTISLFARSDDNQIALTGVAASVSVISLILVPFGDGTFTNTTVISTRHYRNLMQDNSIAHFLRHITKRDTELSGFSVHTEGQTLQMESRTFTTETGATSVYVRYKFVTSEVPGGYFGSRFNDYFSVTIRSEKGGYQTMSQSMNGLGLGAFDYSTGSTDWFILKLNIDGDAQLIQVDIGVANVGDGAYQSSVIVDKIGIDQCEKYDDCDKCPSKPMCQDTCTNPPQQSCLFYQDCMEATVTCGGNGYAVGYGTKYCNKYVSRLSLFSSPGQNWIYKVMNCLQKSMISPLQDFNNDCTTLRNIAFDSHPACYVDSGVCVLPWEDYYFIFTTVMDNILTKESFIQAFKTTESCLPAMIMRVQNALVNAGFYEKVQLLTLLVFLLSL